VVVLSTGRLGPLIWAGFSVFLYLLAAYALVKLRARRPHSPLLHPIVQRVGETALYLGLPYLALLRGDILLRWLGLSGMDWIQGFGIGVALGAGALALACLAFRWSFRDEQDDALPAPGPLPHISRLGLLWKALTLQAHWAFYRAVMIQVLGDAYWGTFAGLALVVLEYVLSAETRLKMRTPAGRRVVARLTLAVLSAILYFYAGNLPLLVLFHWVFEIMLHSALIPWPESHTASS